MEKLIAPRLAIGQTLVEMGGQNPDIVVLDADVALSTSTVEFKKAFPARFFEMGIAEQNMVGTAAGFALAGAVPFVCTFAVFDTAKPFEQIRQSIAFPALNVKIIGSHPGFTVDIDGASHQSVEDLSLMRSLPNMTVLDPADFNETRAVLKAAVNIKGPVYIRAARTPAPLFFDGQRFLVGPGKVLCDGSDVAIISTGIMLDKALKASKKLKDEGIKAKVIHMPTLKPIDERLILKTAQDTGCLVTVENHSVIGGLGSAVSEVTAENYPVPVIKVGIRDRFGTSLPQDRLFKKYGMDTRDIIKAAKKAMDIKSMGIR